MLPTYEKNYIDRNRFNVNETFNDLKNNLDWLKMTDVRYEYFMSKFDLEYTYGAGRGVRTYKSKPFNNIVNNIMNVLNNDFKCSFDICFLNRYDNEKMWLGWHADDSPEIDPNHPIAVVSLGAEREIWIKEMGYKGDIPVENRYMLNNGSLFMMPTGFQKTHYHKIPKWSKPCDTRISLTYRKYVNS
jgi:alkylated DNA repair dioxygenase AlkB